MKTTIEIGDALFREVKRLAAQRRTTLRAIIEAALRQFLREAPTGVGEFKLRHKAFRGQGLQPGLEEGNWSEIRARAYEGRGG